MDNYRTWCEIDLNAIRHNFMQYRNITGNGVKIAAVVKADAYGHGDEACARMLSECGADYFAVAFCGRGGAPSQGRHNGTHSYFGLHRAVTCV